MVSIEKLERKWHIKIADDSYYHPLKRKYIKRYKIYTADGCRWEVGLTYKSLLAEIREYGETFLKIAGV